MLYYCAHTAFIVMNPPRPISRTNAIYTIAVIGFIYTLHLVIPMYSNSSYLELFTNEATVGYIYMAGAAMTILGFILAPNIIRRIGNYRTAIILVIIQMALFWGLIQATSPIIIAFVFIFQAAIVSLIGLTLDIFLEVYTDGPHVGTIRGFYTATLNASWVVAPLIGSMLINGTGNYHNTYIAGFAMLIPLLYLIYRNFPRFKDPTYIHVSPWQLVKRVSINRNWTRLFIANIILQTYYSWMVVYSPVYLNKFIGFSWDDIGIILVVMLLPFPLIQYPLGKLADQRYGEKEIMAIGFAVMGLSTMILSFIAIHSVFVWAAALFLTRVGAAAAEVMIETYFFKTVSPQDSAILGSFRITRPFSYLLAPPLMAGILAFTTHEYAFAAIGLFSLIGLWPVLGIKDTN